MGIYRPPNFNNLDTFFKETNDSLSRASLTYENFIIMGDFNIDINAAGIEADKHLCLFKKPEPLTLELVTIINVFRHFKNLAIHV